MSRLDSIDEETPQKNRTIELLQERELLFFALLIPVSAHRVVTTHNLPQLIAAAIENPSTEYLSRYKGREIVSLDCRSLIKGGARRWMAKLAKKVEKTPNLIVVIENIANLPSGLFRDDPQYVENLLGHSWKNENIFFGKNCISRSQLTVILTATPEQKEFLGQRFRTDGYSWKEDFDQELDAIEKELKSL
jgi:hypothetical protein